MEGFMAWTWWRRSRKQKSQPQFMTERQIQNMPVGILCTSAHEAGAFSSRTPLRTPHFIISWCLLSEAPTNFERSPSARQGICPFKVLSYSCKMESGNGSQTRLCMPFLLYWRSPGTRCWKNLCLWPALFSAVLCPRYLKEGSLVTGLDCYFQSY